MSDSRISEIALAKDRIKGDRRIIVIPEGEEGLKEVTKKLMTQDGAKKIVKGVFIIGGNNEFVRRVVEQIPHISFKKVRDVPKIRDKSQDAKLKRTYALVTYHLGKPSPQQKKRVQRLIAKSVSIRLRPGVLLFPHLRVKDNRMYFETENGKRLLNSKKFVSEMKKLDAGFSRFTHLRILGPRSLALVNLSLERMVRRKCDTLTEKTRLLREAVNDPEIPTIKLKERYSALSLHYKDSKASYDIIHQIMRIESPDPFKKLYDRLLRVRKKIAERN
jgi:hypothetical protein